MAHILQPARLFCSRSSNFDGGSVCDCKNKTPNILAFAGHQSLLQRVPSLPKALEEEVDFNVSHLLREFFDPSEHPDSTLVACLITRAIALLETTRSAGKPRDGGALGFRQGDDSIIRSGMAMKTKSRSCSDSYRRFAWRSRFGIALGARSRGACGV